MLQSLPRVYSLVGLCSGYLLVMLFNPVRQALRDGFRCIARFKRIWIVFAALGFAYSVFQMATFPPFQSTAEFDLSEVTSFSSWPWPRLVDVWGQIPLPVLESVAGIFDNATTTYPVSVIAAVLFIVNWRGLHGAFLSALRKRYPFWSYLIYLVVLLSVAATLFKPIVFWRLPQWGGLVPAAGLLQISATVDAVAFIFEYLFGVYVQVYLITVCLVWVKGLSFQEEALFQFAVRRFSYVLKWAGIVVIVSILIVRAPLLLAYFVNLPGILDYMPFQRFLMCAFALPEQTNP